MIGADPEVFVTHEGQIISAIGLIGGTKDVPIPVVDGALQEDNVLAEFNIDPCRNSIEFVNKINNVMDQLKAHLGTGYDLSIKPSHMFDEEYLMAQPPAALEFGCNPDLNAYTGEENPAPRGCETALRTAGGHVHLSYKNPTPEKSFRIVQILDIVLGIPSVCLDSDNQRRTLYGKAGACRIKAYGVEYRSLSNFWLQEQDYMRWVYHTADDVCKNYFRMDFPIAPEEVQRIINEGDYKAALAVIDELGLETPFVEEDDF